EHVRAGQLRDLHGRGPDSSGRSGHEHGFTGAQASPCDQTTPGRGKREWRRRGAVEIVPAGNRVDVPCRYDDEFGESALCMLAEDPKAYAQRILATDAPFADATREGRIDDHGIARLDVVNAGSERLNDTGDIGAADVGHCRFDGQSAANP